MSTGVYLPSAPATITTVRLPVAITASWGTTSACSPADCLNVTRTNMPGLSARPGLRNSMRAFSVRVARSTSGRIADSLPLIMLPGPAACTSAALPTRSCEASASGTSAITQTELRSAMRNRVMPDETMAPSRTPSSATTPEVGANSVKRICAVPDCSERVTTSSGMDNSRSRARDASISAGPGWACRTPRYSSSAAAHSGAYSVASACPLRTGSSTARTCSFST